jgi:hypothetical protein
MVTDSIKNGVELLQKNKIKIGVEQNSIGLSANCSK